MINKVKISIVNQDEKFEKVQLVKPNMIYNRFDIKYNGDFDVLKINYKGKEQYISYHITKKNVCYVGIYMTELEQCVFNKILQFLKMKYPKIVHVHITQSLIKHPDLIDKMHWRMDLPDTVEEYYAQFSSKTRYNRRRELKKLKETFNVEFEYYPREKIDRKIMERFFEFKDKTEDDVYYETDDEGINTMLSDFYNITDAYVLKLNGQIESCIFFSITDDEDLYCENMAYNKDFSEYNIGQILYYYSIERLIERGFKHLYLGGGNYKYKRNSGCQKSETMSGNIKAGSIIVRDKIIKKFARFARLIFEAKNEGQNKVITIMGIKKKYKRNIKKYGE